MNEDLKIAEAEYFLAGVLRESTRNPEATRHELSAFLSAARSALLYAFEEVDGTEARHSWYEPAVSTAHPVVKFVKDTRDINVHHRPFSMRTNVTIGIPSGSFTFASTGTIVVTTDAHGDPSASRPSSWPTVSSSSTGRSRP